MWLICLLLALAMIMLVFMGFNLCGQNINLIMVCIPLMNGGSCHVLGYKVQPEKGGVTISFETKGIQYL